MLKVNDVYMMNSHSKYCMDLLLVQVMEKTHKKKTKKKKQKQNFESMPIYRISDFQKRRFLIYRCLSNGFSLHSMLNKNQQQQPTKKI